MFRRLLIGLLMLAPLLLWAANPTTLRVVDLRWIKDQPELETWLGSLQGTLNRQPTEQPVFLVRTDTDAAIADTLIRAYDLKKEVFTPGALLETAKPGLTGQVLYDAAKPAMRNRALSFAACAPGNVIATDHDLGLHTELDLRAAPDKPLAFAPTTTLILAPNDFHLLGDFIAYQQTGVTDPDTLDDAVLKRLGMNIRVVGTTGDDAADAAFRRKIATARGAEDFIATPVRYLSNLSCYARFAPLRPAQQYREEATIKDGTELLVLIYESTGSLDDVTGRLIPLLDDPALAGLPVGIEVPAGLADYAPALYQRLLARLHDTAAEFLAAPSSGVAAPGAAKMDFAAVSLSGDNGAWASPANLQEATTGPWRCAFLRKGAGALPAYQGVPDGFPVFPAYGRAATVAELRRALTKMDGPVQVLYLDPRGLPPSVVAAMLKEITYSRSLATPSQAFRARELTAVLALFEKQRQQKIRFPDRLNPTLKVSAPTTTLKTPTAETPIPISVRVQGNAGVLTARLVYSDPTGRVLAADLTDAGGGLLTATLPAMLTGGKVDIRARVVEKGGLGITLTPSLTLDLPVVDSDNDGVDDALEAYRGSDPHNPDTDGDGLPDVLDPHPTVADRDVMPLFAPIFPPADKAFLADAGKSTAGDQGRAIPAGSSVTYRIPMKDLPATGTALRVAHVGAGTVSLNGGDPVKLMANVEQSNVTDIPLGKGVGAALTVTCTAGETPLRLTGLSLITNPDGPYLVSVRLNPAVPPAGVPIHVQAVIYSPAGMKAVALRYGAALSDLKILDLKPTDGTGGTIYEGDLPAQEGGSLLLYGLLAKDAQDHVMASPYSVAPVGKTRKFNVALVPGRDLLGDWQPAALWGGFGHALLTGTATDTRKPVLRPGAYTAWLLAMPRARGITVRFYTDATLSAPATDRLAVTVPAGAPDGWFKLGKFTLTAQDRVRMDISPAGMDGFTAYGALVLTQDPDFIPPLTYAGIDWYNAVIVSGVSDGQTITGDKITLKVRVTGNLDMIDVVATSVHGAVSSGDKHFIRGADGNYTLDVRGLPPGDYAIKAVGYRVVSGADPVPLVTAKLTVTIPEH